jgi:phosphoenolpyruvate synthase/pyruvate phosphate dikinase
MKKDAKCYKEVNKMGIKLTYKVQHKFPTIKPYRFGKINDESVGGKEVLGGKGQGLFEMANLGLPVPSGFTLPCEASVLYNECTGKPSALAAYMHHLWSETKVGLDYIQETMGGVTLLSVRSGSRISMPGMLDSILNVGITSTTLPYWVETLGPRAAYDSYRRLIQMYSSIALGVPMSVFDTILDTLKKEFKVTSDTEITDIGMKVVAETYLATLESMGIEFPNTQALQLRGAIVAVFKSWDNPRAQQYRELNNIPYEWGTAVTIQSMVFGNLNDQSATGVLFTRDPSTGINEITGEFLVNAQGEDVVAGVRTPLALNEMTEWNEGIFWELGGVVNVLETHYKDMQDVEFTIQDGKLYILQTRTGKRSAKAAFKIARDLAIEGVISKQEAVAKVTSSQLLAIMQDTIDPAFNIPPAFTGIAAGGGLVSGVAVFDLTSAINCTTPCILVRHETSPDDLMGINAAVGILTATGGLTCFEGDTPIMTNKGLIQVKELHTRYISGEYFELASYTDDLIPVWRELQGAKKSVSEVATLTIGKAGRETQSILKVTPNHKFMVPVGDTFGKTRLDELPEKASVLVAKELPFLHSRISDKDPEFFYLLGLIFTDGYIKANKRRGFVIFSQKKEGTKVDVIERFKEGVLKYFNKQCTVKVRPPCTPKILPDGRAILGSGEHIQVSFFSKGIAYYLLSLRNNIGALMLGADKEQAIAFLAGCADGDGASNKNKLHLYISREDVKQGIVVAAIKADVRSSCHPNRTITNIELSFGADSIGEYSSRHNAIVKSKTPRRKYRAVDFNSRITPANYVLRTRLNNSVERDLLLDGNKVGVDLPIESNWAYISKEEKHISEVYDFTVKSDTGIGHSYLVMASGGQLVWVSNCHAAVVARSMNKACVVGVGNLVINSYGAYDSNGGATFKNGYYLTIDGATGNVWVHDVVPVIPGGPTIEATELLSWGYLMQEGVVQRVSMTESINPLETYLKTIVANEVYIDTATATKFGALEIGTTKEVFSALGSALEKLPDVSIVLDLTPIEGAAERIDCAAWGMLGLTEVALGNRANKRMIAQAVEIALWSDAVKSRLTVKLPDNVSSAVIKELSGIKLQNRINTVADLLSATSSAEVSDKIIQTVFGGADAYNKLVSLLEQHTGVKLSGAVKVPRYWYSILQ